MDEANAYRGLMAIEEGQSSPKPPTTGTAEFDSWVWIHSFG